MEVKFRLMQVRRRRTVNWWQDDRPGGLRLTARMAILRLGLVRLKRWP